MALKKKPSKWTKAQIKKHSKEIQAFIAREKRKVKKGDNFSSISDEEIEGKLMRVNSPMIVSQGWSGSAPQGGTINYNVGIYNPDPVSSGSLYVHVWVGSGNIDPNVGTFLLNVDNRFQRLTEPSFFGFSLAPGASTSINFTLSVPNVVNSNYLGCSCLMQLNSHDVGTYLDRGSFPFQVN